MKAIRIHETGDPDVMHLEDEESLQVLAPYGRMAIFGAASGQIAQFTGIQLMYKNQAIIGYWLSAWMQRPDRIVHAVSVLMHYLATGQLEIVVGATFPLAEAAAAHRAIAARQTTGKVVLLV